MIFKRHPALVAGSYCCPLSLALSRRERAQKARQQPCHPELCKANQRGTSCVSLHPSAKPLGVSGSYNRDDMKAPHPNPPPQVGRELKVCHPELVSGSYRHCVSQLVRSRNKFGMTYKNQSWRNPSKINQ